MDVFFKKQSDKFPVYFMEILTDMCFIFLLLCFQELSMGLLL